MLRRAGVFIAVLAAVAGASLSLPVRAQQPPPPLAIEGPVRIVGAAEIAVSGAGRYAGVVEVGADGYRGLGAVVEVSLEEYVAGVAEMPASWPQPALQAQAIAARTYALWEAGQPRVGEQAVLRYDICATQACQVYAGLDKADDVRWRAAVEATAGLILVEPDGRPILARYSSIAGGRTRFNQDVFIAEGSYPWLVAVDAPEEAVEAPLLAWQVVVPRDRLERVLAENEEIRPRGALAALDVLSPPEGAGLPTRVLIRGTEGDRTVRASTFARAFSTTAERLFPDAFPGELPGTFPSSRYTLTLRADALVIDGRGFGHGVGLSQWGAKALADQGFSADEILARYYGGLVPAGAARQEPMRVGVLDGEPAIALDLTGPADVVDVFGRPVATGVSGTVLITLRADGALDVAMPSAGPGAPGIASGLDLVRRSIVEGDASPLSVVLATRRPVAVTATGPAGEALTGPVVEAGPGRWTVPLPALAPGRWSLTVDGAPRAVVLDVVALPPPPTVPPAAVTGSRRWLPAAAVAALVGVGGLVLLGMRHNRRAL